MFKKIVVIARGADAEEPAVRRAVLCASIDTELALLDVVHEPVLDGYLGNAAVYERLRERVVAERRERITALAAELRARGLKATGEAFWGYPLDEVVAGYARLQHADLVVTAPADAPGGGLFHADWRLIATCPAPVLVVKGPAQARYRHVVAAVDPFHAHAKPADLDRTILVQARALEAHDGAALTVLHCHTPVEYFGSDLSAPVVYDAHDGGRREALEELLRTAGIATSAARIAAGAPHAALQQLAERGEADVIVMGALSRGRLKDWLIGSTAERVLQRVRADVLAVRPAAAG